MEILHHDTAEIHLESMSGGKRRIHVLPHDPNLYIQGNGWETRYPFSLIKKILDVKGPSYLCDEIAREEDPLYVPLNLDVLLFSYVSKERFDAGSRILDFGCGTGASSVFLGRNFPKAEIIGIDLVPESLEIADARKHHYGIENVRFLVSPSGDSLPPGIGTFDGILFSAVFEHLLPAERETLMPMIWEMLNPGAILFLNETPNRLFPLELHTTGLPLINYLPRSMAHWAARSFSKRVSAFATWEDLLREGIRGGAEREILRCLGSPLGSEVEIIRPCRMGRTDNVDLWYDRSVRKSGRSLKKDLFKTVVKALQKLLRVQLTPEITLALKKIK